MQPAQHANLLSIFAWIMSGFQLMLVLFFGLYVLMAGFVSIGMALDPDVKDPGGPIIMGVMATVFGVVTLVGLAGSISNFLLGRRLCNSRRPTQRFLIVTAIINFLSVATGGIFAMALGVYTLWFATSDAGKLFCAGTRTQPLVNGLYTPNAYDPNRVNWR